MPADGATVFTAADLAAVKPIVPALHKSYHGDVRARANCCVWLGFIDHAMR